MTSRRLIEQLHSLYPDASRRSLKQWLASSRVRVNGTVVVRGDVELDPGDRVELASPLPPPIPPPLRLVHEDDEILVIDKPSGLLTIATESERERTAYRLLRDWFSRRGAATHLFIVHRLDRETSGLLVFAKSAAAKEHLQAQFAVRTAERLYVALAEGVMMSEAVTVPPGLLMRTITAFTSESSAAFFSSSRNRTSRPTRGVGAPMTRVCD